MSEETEEKTTALVPTELVPTVHLVARNAEEMAAAKGKLHVWFTQKLAYVAAEIAELTEAVDKATKQRWNRSALKRALNSQLAQQSFYTKCLGAVDAGYAIVPDFPIDIFAIRVARAEPTPYHMHQQWSYPEIPNQEPDNLNAGEGDYVSEKAQSYTFTERHKKSDGTEIQCYHRRTTSFGLKDVAFPMQVARVKLLDSTAEAMQLKVFDQIGMCPPRKVKKPDPMIIGQIILRDGAKTRTLNFLLGWTLNMNEL